MLLKWTSYVGRIERGDNNVAILPFAQMLQRASLWALRFSRTWLRRQRVKSQFAADLAHLRTCVGAQLVLTLSGPPRMTYTVVRELGRGGFGRVHEVVDDAGQHFALKCFDPNDEMRAIVARGFVTLDELKKRFHREVKYQGRVSSQNVVEIIDYDLDADEPWYVMELAAGTLQEDLQNDRTLGGDPGPALFDILAGLQAIHELGFVHRDLKPVNVLKFIDDEGTARYAISDFGLITAIASETTTLTRTGQGGGTPIYAAPELITRFKYATAAADIYSFGAILHDIFGGGNRTPYVELSVPGPCRAIVEKCTKKQAIRRYQNIAELRADLYEALRSPDLAFASTEVREIVNALTEKDELSDPEWDRFFELLVEAEPYPDRYNLFRAVRVPHIDQLAATEPELFNALGIQFSEYVRDTSHDFNYCDVLADKLQHMYSTDLVGLKAHILLTLLIMGVDHNRWYVERKFLNLAGLTLEEQIAERFMLDVEMEGIDLENYLSRWERSIGSSRDSIHPLIAGA